jgi:hypothetical protein
MHSLERAFEHIRAHDTLHKAWCGIGILCTLLLYGVLQVYQHRTNYKVPNKADKPRV